MYQNWQYEVDPKDPLKPLYQGTFEEKVTVGGKERRYLVYIPKNARPSTAGVFILPENGKIENELYQQGHDIIDVQAFPVKDVDEVTTPNTQPAIVTQ